MIYGIIDLLISLVRLYMFVIVGYCIFSFLYAFGIVDPRNRFVYAVGNFLTQMSEPVLTPIRRILPTIGNMDFSPIVLFLIINYLIIPLLVRLKFSYFL